MSGWPWSQLGLARTADKGAIRRAYAQRLKALDLDREVAAYDALRSARDEALRRAGVMAQQPVAGDGAAHGLHDEDSELAGVDWPDEADDEWASDAGWFDHIEPPAAHGFAGAAEGAAAHPPDAMREAAEAAWQALAVLLFPDHEPSEAAFTLDEHRQASDHLATLIARAEECEVAEHELLDYRLAEMLAESWPRSAPLVEQANAGFHWLDEAGQLDERPALMFLNARIEGMRFHEEVQDPRHSLHTAWVELSSPGDAGWFKRFRVEKSKVTALLTLIRSDFPELESLLNGERVASWDTGGESVLGWIGGRFIWIILAAQLLRFCDTGNGDTNAPPLPLTEFGQSSERRADALASEVFGVDTTAVMVKAKSPELADTLQSLSGIEEPKAVDLARGQVRRAILTAREDAKFETLVWIDQTYLGWLKAAQATSPAACAGVRDGSFDPPIKGIDAGALIEERHLARTLLDDGLLNGSTGTGDRTFAVPGWLIAETQAKVGLTDAQMQEVLKDPGHADRCRMTIAMFEVMLAKPGKVPLDLLRGL